jgi:acyl carrier protein
MDRKQLAHTLQELVEHETGQQYGQLDDAVELRDGLNLDSLDLVTLVLQIENQLHVSIDTEELTDVTTVGGMLDLLERKLAAKDRRHAA